MSAVIKDTIKHYQLLTQEWNKKPCNVVKCGELLNILKLSLTQLAYLPTNDSAVTKQELMLARDILEIGARWAIDTRDIPCFERYMAQLKNYYYDYKSELPQSVYKYELIGLNLLCLLSQNRLAEFHAELERLPIEDLLTNIYIRHPISMEQYLMEGSYNKVFLSKGNVPSPRYNFFIDILLDTTRDEIANCIEAAYTSLSLPEAQRMLFFDSPDQMQEYAIKRKWNIEGKKSYQFKQSRCESADSIPAKPIAELMIKFAVELDKIV